MREFQFQDFRESKTLNAVRSYMIPSFSGKRGTATALGRRMVD